MKENFRRGATNRGTPRNMVDLGDFLQGVRALCGEVLQDLPALNHTLLADPRVRKELSWDGVILCRVVEDDPEDSWWAKAYQEGDWDQPPCWF